MIEFVTLLLGLVTGPRGVEVAVDAPVTAVELRLDGAAVGRRDRPPWYFAVDLGDEPAPHELVAVGFDADGAEVGRARQWINLPREPAEARLHLTADAEGWPASAGISWASLWSRRPEGIEVRFDGRPLAVADPARFELPRYDREEVHILTAEVHFAHDQRVRVEANFGGVFGERVTTELTAVPVVGANRRAPKLDEVRSLFVGAGGPLDAIAVESGGADVVFVRDRPSQEAVGKLVGGVQIPTRPGTFMLLTPNVLSLQPKDRVVLVWPAVSRRRPGAGRTLDPRLFGASAAEPSSAVGIASLLAWTKSPPLPERVADAVAVAGLKAVEAGRPRAVVLVVDPATPDPSDLSPAQVRRYLARLHVPLFVWTAAEDPGRMIEEWGEVTSVATWRGLRDAARDLRAALDHQAIVWLDGAHLPQTIRLREGAEELAIAGAGAESGGSASPPGNGG